MLGGGPALRDGLQTGHMARVSEPMGSTRQKQSINGIAQDCLTHILSFMRVDELARIVATCRAWRRAAESCMLAEVAPRSSSEAIGVLSLIRRARALTLCDDGGTATCARWLRPPHLASLTSALGGSLRRLDMGLWFETKNSPLAHRFKVLPRAPRDLEALRCPLKCLSRSTRGLSQLQQLRKLSLGSSGCSSALVRSVTSELRSLPALEWLHLQAFLDQELAAEIAQCTSLRRLSLGGEGLTDEAAQQLSALTKLEYLDASGSDDRHATPVCLSDAGLAALKTISTLTALNLNGNQRLTDAGVADLLRSLPRTRVLSLGAPRVGDLALRAVTDRGAPVVALGLMGTAVTAQGLQGLKDLKELKILDLSFCYQLDNDATVASLAALRGVWVNMEETGVRGRRLAALRDAIGDYACADGGVSAWSSIGSDWWEATRGGRGQQ